MLVMFMSWEWVMLENGFYSVIAANRDDLDCFTSACSLQLYWNLEAKTTWLLLTWFIPPTSDSATDGPPTRCFLCFLVCLSHILSPQMLRNLLRLKLYNAATRLLTFIVMTTYFFCYLGHGWTRWSHLLISVSVLSWIVTFHLKLRVQGNFA